MDVYLIIPLSPVPPSLRYNADFTKKMPRTTTLECPGCPSLRALTFDTLGLIKGEFFSYTLLFIDRNEQYPFVKSLSFGFCMLYFVFIYLGF